MYSELWHASKCLLDVGTERPKGSSWQFLSSIVLTAFTFEAYMNHVGESLLKCWPEMEKLPPWSKLQLISEKLGVEFAEGCGARPLQTVIKILEFRNTMAHGKSQKIVAKDVERDVNDYLDGYLSEIPPMEWERLIKTKDFAERAREDLKKVCEAIHAARPQPKEGLVTFGRGLHGAAIVAPT